MESRQNEKLLMVQPNPMAEYIRDAAAEAGWVLETAPGIMRALQSAAAQPKEAVLLHVDGNFDIAAAVEEFQRLGEHTEILVTAESPVFIPGVHRSIIIPCSRQYLYQMLKNSLECHRTLFEAAALRAENEKINRTFELQSRRMKSIETAWAEINRSLCDMQALLDNSLELFQQEANTKRISLMLIDEKKEMRILAARGVPSEVVAMTRVRVGEGVSGWVARHGRPLMARDNIVTRQTGGTGRDYHSDYFLSLPLKTDGEMIGVINMTEREDCKPFKDEDIRRLVFLAEQAALWISHSRRLINAERLSLVDELTSLYNRRFLMTELAREIERSNRNDKSFSVAMMDIDHFKIYNDRRGHQSGDELLRQLALVLRKNLRSADIICRYGGEEFAIILPGSGEKSSDEQEGAHFIDRVRRIISSFPFMGLDVMPQKRLTVSAGVAVFPYDGNSSDQLIGVADDRLYKAKSSGRNMVVSRTSIESPAKQSPGSGNK